MANEPGAGGASVGEQEAAPPLKAQNMGWGGGCPPAPNFMALTACSLHYTLPSIGPNNVVTSAMEIWEK